jgi:CRP-like cAMP-binding protein
MELKLLIEHYLGKKFSLDAASIEGITAAIDRLSFQKGEKAFSENQVVNHVYFMVRGGARSYYLKDGIEVTTWFAFEGDSVGSLQGYKGNPSRETVEFMEDSECLRIDLTKLKEKQKNDLAVSHFISAVIEEYALFLEDRLRQLQYNEGLHRYLYILEHEPYLLQRVSLTHLASYLGIARETLSRLRAKINL